MLGLGRLGMYLGLPRGLSTHEQSPRPRPDEGLAGTFASFAIIRGVVAYICIYNVTKSFFNGLTSVQ